MSTVTEEPDTDVEATTEEEAALEQSLDAAPDPLAEPQPTEPAEIDAKKKARIDELHQKIYEDIGRIESLTSDLDDLKLQQKEIKASIDVCNKRLIDTRHEIRDVLNGQFQPNLPFGDATPQAVKPTEPLVDEGALLDLDVLETNRLIDLTPDYAPDKGLTAAKIEALKEACEGHTIGHLEKWIKSDAYWHQKIKGFGEQWIERTIDALTAVRRQFPIPNPEAEDEPEEEAMDDPADQEVDEDDDADNETDPEDFDDEDSE